jgi:Mannosylglycerate hydrolase MGH1-like glycoside hydrolase domain
VPFSTFGAWMNLSCVTAQDAVADDVHLVSHQSGFHPVLRLVPASRGDRAEVTLEADPARLAWRADAGCVEAAWELPDTLRITGHGLGLSVLAVDPVLTPFSGSYFFGDPASGAHVLTTYETGRRHRITVLSGSAQVLGDQSLGAAERGLLIPDDAGPWEVSVEELETARPPYRPEGTFAEVVGAAASRFRGFLDAIAPWRDDTTPAAALAGYVLWSAAVQPAGYLSRPAVLMAKHWMDKVWSWDHCFNALALTGLPGLAWDQFHTPFDHQDAAGALPDSVAHSQVLRNFVKPPVHGWALVQLLRACPLDDDGLREVYRRVARWTEFWLAARRAPGSQLPHYQHGNDSGWANATTFDQERVVETADLAAFLVLQLEALAALAADLGLGEEAARWASTGDALLASMLRELWTGDGFIARGALSRRATTSSSLLDLMPVVLGERLPAEVSAWLAGRIRAHLTGHGLATEHPTSACYQPDGYWRGPVWAPATVLVEDGLRRAGHVGLADDVSRRFRSLCELAGFPENFDALTGVGQRDRAYTWTASSYLLLAAAHRARQEQPASQHSEVVVSTGQGSFRTG